MGKLVVVDECLIPRRLAWINYKGPDPMGFMKDYRKNLRFIFEVSTTRTKEKKLLWDYTGDPIRFYDEWEIKKEMSRFTTMFVTTRALGYVSKGKKDGDFSLEVYGELVHTFSPSNWFTKYVWLLYNYMFYGKLRERQLDMCRDYINNFLNWCREKYGMKNVTTPEAAMEELTDHEMGKFEKMLPKEGPEAETKEGE